jgi:hypothetical protein
MKINGKYLKWKYSILYGELCVGTIYQGQTYALTTGCPVDLDDFKKKHISIKEFIKYPTNKLTINHIKAMIVEGIRQERLR